MRSAGSVRRAPVVLNRDDLYAGLRPRLSDPQMPKGSAESWVQKLYDQHLTGKAHPHFRKPRMSSSSFIVLHFADTVSEIQKSPTAFCCS